MFTAIMLVILSVVLLTGARACFAGETAKIQVDACTSLGEISPLIYGQFLEHICHSTDLGLHAEMLTERSFEYRGVPYEKPALGNVHIIGNMWEVDDGKAVSSLVAGGAALFAGEATLTDYDLEVSARTTTKCGALWVAFRVRDLQESYLWEVGGTYGGMSTLASRKNGVTRNIAQVPLPGEPDDWRNARVEVRGTHIVCKLDGRVLHDVDDSDHPAGMAGLAFVATSGEVREFKLSAPAGDILYQIPLEKKPSGQPQRNDVGKGWDPVGFETGAVEAVRDTEHPFNSRYSLRLTLSSSSVAPAGVQQRNLPATRDTEYRGYVYLRCRDFSGRGEVVWRNADGSKIYARAPLACSGKEWRQVPFTLRPDSTDPDAAIAFLFEGHGTVWLDQASLMPASTNPRLPFRQDLLEAVAALKPSIIRYPGGCFASIYDWRDGVGPVDERRAMPIFDWAGVGGLDPNHFGTDEFIALCRKVGAEPFLVTNLALGPKCAAQWVEYCNGDVTTPMGSLRARNGHPEPYHVKYWSIDNELWLLDSRHYGRMARESVEAMRQVDPSLVFWLVGCFMGIEAFNEGVLHEVGEYCDYLSIHYYGEGPYEKVCASNLPLEDWFLKLERQVKELIPGKKVLLAFDEWNPGGTEFYFGLASAAFLNSMERNNQIVGMSAPALFLRNRKLSTKWDNALIQFDQTRHYVTPTYLAVRMYSENYAPERIASTVECGGYALEGQEKPIPYLDAVATRDLKDGRVVLKVVNRHKTEPVRASISVSLPAERKAELVAKVVTLDADAIDAANSLDRPDRVKLVETRIENAGSAFVYDFPAHSATVITLRLQNS
jgi:alpha-N-arabinofuranosidase